MTTEIKIDQKKWAQAAEMVRIGVYTINEIRAFLELPSLGISGNVTAKPA